MPKSLIIVESPAKSKTIKKFVGANYQVKASVGHVKDLPKKELGVDIANDFQVTYVAIRGKGKILKELREAAGKADHVYLATDPDREGEAIAWHIANEIKRNSNKVRRVLFNEITRNAVQKALKTPIDINMLKVNAQQARRVMDRLVGYQVSPFLWKTLHSGLSAGRVQSVALRLICEREKEIKVFVPEESWSILALVQGASRVPFTVKLLKIGKDKAEIPNETRAKAVVEDLKKQVFRVAQVKRTQRRKNPYPPFTTSTLQQDAARRLRFSAQKTMRVAQQLYEGLEIGEAGTTGLITYMRTDSTRIAGEALQAVRQQIVGDYGKAYVPSKARVFRSKASSQDAHEAIRPTNVAYRPVEIEAYLSADQFKLYELIWKRFVACQMSAAVFDVTTIDVKAGSYLLRATGSIPKFDGFLKVYQELKSGDEQEEENQTLPEVKKDEILNLLRVTPKQHFTKPPPRYSEASLVKELEAKGIGRPSTYAQIIDTLRRRQYVSMKARRFHATELGITVNGLLVKTFPAIFNVKFTAQMESELDRVETGEVEWVRVLEDFYTPFSKRLQQVSAQKSAIKESLVEPTGERCEKCGREMVIKWGRNGRFIACSGFPQCKNTRPLEGKAADQPSDEKCDQCGSPMVIKRGRFGPFLACSAYPKCRNTRPLGIGVPCPEPDCSGSLIKRRSRRGRTFYGCSRYPECQFATWDQPIAEVCDECASPVLVEKTGKDGTRYRRCPRCRKKTVLHEI